MTLHSLDGIAPKIHPDAWIAPTASVLGDVEIGAESSVFYGAVLRADREAIRIGARTNLQDQVVVHADPGFPAVLGDGVTVGHAAVLHGCTVEDDVLIGIGAIVLNGAVIGSQSLVGAGAVVPGGMRIPPRSMVLGAPAKVRRELTDDEVESIVENGRRYVEVIATHRAAEEI